MYYSQRLRPVSLNATTDQTVSTKVADIRKRLNDPTQALVPVKGGHGGYGAGLEVMKARNAGEAKWAKKMGRNFTDSKMRELHKTRVAFVHNSQKRQCCCRPCVRALTVCTDFRDPLCEFDSVHASAALTSVQCSDRALGGMPYASFCMRWRVIRHDAIGVLRNATVCGDSKWPPPRLVN